MEELERKHNDSLTCSWSSQRSIRPLQAGGKERRPCSGPPAVQFLCRTAGVCVYNYVEWLNHNKKETISSGADHVPSGRQP